MKDIKFRGFDKENNCWRYGFYTKMLEGARIFHAIIVEDESAEYRFTRWYIHNKKTISQFTGFQDKSGKDIYEGDIISSAKYMWKEKGEHQVRPVFYKDGCFCIGRVALNILFPQFYPEVIGNIHENKDLLK